MSSGRTNLVEGTRALTNRGFAVIDKVEAAWL